MAGKIKVQLGGVVMTVAMTMIVAMNMAMADVMTTVWVAWGYRSGYGRVW